MAENNPIGPVPNPQVLVSQSQQYLQEVVSAQVEPVSGEVAALKVDLQNTNQQLGNTNQQLSKVLPGIQERIDDLTTKLEQVLKFISTPQPVPAAAGPAPTPSPPTAPHVHRDVPMQNVEIVRRPFYSRAGDAEHDARVMTEMTAIRRWMAEACLFVDGTSPNMCNWTRKERQDFAKGMPKYQHLAGQFSDHIYRMIRYISQNGVDMTIDNHAGYLQLAVAETLGSGPAELFLLTRQELDALPLSTVQYLAEMRLVLEPPVNSAEYRQAFKVRAQQRHETVRVYVESKYKLFKRANNKYTDADDLVALREGIVEGLLNPVLKRRAYEIIAPTYVKFKELLCEYGAQELAKHRNGIVTGSRDGLITEVEAKAWVDKRTQSTADPVPSVNEVRGSRRGQAGSGSGSRKVCWDCGSTSHFQRSSACTAPGAKKFWPKNKGPATGLGGNRSNRRNPGRSGSVPTVNQLGPVEEKEVEEQTAQDSFLEPRTATSKTT